MVTAVREIMKEMQEKWKDEWEQTSQHRFRSPEDMQYAFAYYYYVIHRHKARLVSDKRRD
jgi:hypothetical protein